MSDFKLTFQEEVRRLARKEVKAASETLAAQLIAGVQRPGLRF